MIPVAEARARIVAAFQPVAAEIVSLDSALDRVLAEDLTARVTQPPVAVSAMDGYAVRAADVAAVPAILTRIGEAPAGAAFEGRVGSGECVRIFTGGPLPDGADTIVIQENVTAQGTQVTVRESAPRGHYVRKAGLDFIAGAVGIRTGTRLGVRDVAFAAAMNRPWVKVRRRPRVAIIATGDEIVLPGDPIGPSQIVSSNGLAVAAFVRKHGGDPIHLGNAPDSEQTLRDMAAGARGADLLVTSGGVSVGDHDLVRKALGDSGLAVDFWQIAMRPGKPLMFGHIGDTPVIGLPGNPVSSLVCSLLFVGPALAAMLAVAGGGQLRTGHATLGVDLPANDRREDYLRAELRPDGQGGMIALPFAKQDSAMLSLLRAAASLVIRRPLAPAAKAGDPVEIVGLD